jgi:hypothetical protein
MSDKEYERKHVTEGENRDPRKPRKLERPAYKKEKPKKK